jgi:hypothetical protein
MKMGLLKSALLSLTIFLVYAAQSQSSLFVRVYDMNGIKIHKGRITTITDSSIRLGKSNIIISVKNIGFIRTKHSFGHNILISSAITGISLATLLALSSDGGKGFLLSWTVPEGIGLGLLVGATWGPIIGAGTALFKNTIKFPIKGSEKNWKEFQQYYMDHK